MHGGTRSIGPMARESGLSVSALRFYDGAGVLTPAAVDPVTGYRRYSDQQVAQARLIATLRRVRMPVAGICRVLAARNDPIAAGRLLDEHLRRLEDGLADARRQLDAARALLTTQEMPVTTLTVLGGALADALRAVRFAVGTDPGLPALGGVLFDYDGAALQLVASDRYRLSVAAVALTDRDGPAVQVIAPPALLDRHRFARDAEVVLQLDAGSVSIDGARTPAVDAVFPDYRRLLRSLPDRQVTLGAAELRHRLASGPTRTVTQAPGHRPHDVSVVRITDDGLDVLAGDAPGAAGFNREFLLEAIDAGTADQLVLALDGPVSPLAVLDPNRPGDVSLLMPTRLAAAQ